VYTHIHTYEHTNIYASNTYTYVYMYSYPYPYPYIYSYISPCIPMISGSCGHSAIDTPHFLYVYMYMHIYIYIYIYICIKIISCTYVFLHVTIEMGYSCVTSSKSVFNVYIFIYVHLCSDIYKLIVNISDK
jgi:hypothetical protein